VSDTPIIASALRPRIASDPWGHALGIEFLDRDNFGGVDWSAAEAVV